MPDAMPTALPPGHGHVIVCEVDHLGLRTIDELRRRDEDVVAIAATDDAREALAALDLPITVVGRVEAAEGGSPRAELRRRGGEAVPNRGFDQLRPRRPR